MKGYFITIPNADYSSIAIGKITPESKTKISVVASPMGGGVVSGGGLYDVGTTVTLSATASEGYSFVGWNDGDTNPTRTIVIGNNDVTYTAIFTASQTLYADVTFDSTGTKANVITGLNIPRSTPFKVKVDAPNMDYTKLSVFINAWEAKGVLVSNAESGVVYDVQNNYYDTESIGLRLMEATTFGSCRITIII